MWVIYLGWKSAMVKHFLWSSTLATHSLDLTPPPLLLPSLSSYPFSRYNQAYNIDIVLTFMSMTIKPVMISIGTAHYAMIQCKWYHQMTTPYLYLPAAFLSPPHEEGALYTQGVLWTIMISSQALTFWFNIKMNLNEYRLSRRASESSRQKVIRAYCMYLYRRVNNLEERYSSTWKQIDAQ